MAPTPHPWIRTVALAAVLFAAGLALGAALGHAWAGLACAALLAWGWQALRLRALLARLAGRAHPGA